MKECDPEWDNAWATDTASAGFDHATMLGQNKVLILLAPMT
ncbi:hypothetical protein [Amycolatopsis sp. DG1A-15b]|nr:hypothetical protein [Amycolatopsis sp. DG1A-15b]WIX92474.1 hypothetical protein QRY02_19350 [Amycolatopsis sp. DG1A-15b]